MKRLYLAIVFLAITQIVMPQVPVVLVAGQSNTDGRVDNAELPQLGHPLDGAPDCRALDDGTTIRFTTDSQFEVTFPDGHRETWNPSPVVP